MNDLRGRGLLYVDTPEGAAAELELVRRRVHALLDELPAAIGDDRAVALDNGVCELESVIQGALTARLVAALVAVNDAAVTVFIAPGRVMS